MCMQGHHDNKGLSLKQNKNENKPCETICEWLDGNTKNETMHNNQPKMIGIV